MLFNMLCCERAWWDFVSYDPRLPEGLKTFIVRLERDEKRIAEIEEDVIRFNNEVEADVAFLRQRVKEPPAPPVDTRSALEWLNDTMDKMELVP
jgi:hypothetical protein